MSDFRNSRWWRMGPREPRYFFLAAALAITSLAFAGKLINDELHTLPVSAVITGNVPDTCVERRPVEHSSRKYENFAFPCLKPIARYELDGATWEFQLRQRLTGETRLGEQVELRVDGRSRPPKASEDHQPVFFWLAAALLASLGGFFTWLCGAPLRRR